MAKTIYLLKLHKAKQYLQWVDFMLWHVPVVMSVSWWMFLSHVQEVLSFDQAQECTSAWPTKNWDKFQLLAGVNWTAALKIALNISKELAPRPVILWLG